MAIEIPLMSNKTNLSDNGFEIEEQAEIYEATLEDVYHNVSWYLQNLESLRTYRVAWHDYRNDQAPVPYRFTDSEKDKN